MLAQCTLIRLALTSTPRGQGRSVTPHVLWVRCVEVEAGTLLRYVFRKIFLEDIHVCVCVFVCVCMRTDLYIYMICMSECAAIINLQKRVDLKEP